MEENAAADDIVLTPEQLSRLNELPSASGERHDEAGMAAIDRSPAGGPDRARGIGDAR